MSSILVAVSDAMVREFTAVVLTRAGYTATPVGDGTVAVALLPAPDSVFVAAVMDSRLPHPSGQEIAIVVRNLRPDFPIVLLSGRAVSDQLSDGIPLLCKPFRPAELVRLVGEMIANAKPHET